MNKLYIAKAIMTREKRVVIACEKRHEFTQKLLKAMKEDKIEWEKPKYRFILLEELSQTEFNNTALGEVQIVEWWT